MVETVAVVVLNKRSQAEEFRHAKFEQGSVRKICRVFARLVTWAIPVRALERS